MYYSRVYLRQELIKRVLGGHGKANKGAGKGSERGARRAGESISRCGSSVHVLLTPAALEIGALGSSRMMGTYSCDIGLNGKGSYSMSAVSASTRDEIRLNHCAHPP